MVVGQEVTKLCLLAGQSNAVESVSGTVSVPRLILDLGLRPSSMQGVGLDGVQIGTG